MTEERCPDCGKLISFRFPLHDCKPLKENEPTLLAGKKTPIRRLGENEPTLLAGKKTPIRRLGEK